MVMGRGGVDKISLKCRKSFNNWIVPIRIYNAFKVLENVIFDSKNINIFDLSKSTVWDLCLGGIQLNEHEHVHHSIIYSIENIGSFLCPTNTLWLIPLKNILNR